MKKKHNFKKGDKIHRFTIIKGSYKKGSQYNMIDVKCECGKEKTIPARKVGKGIIKSCGCLQKEIAAKWENLVLFRRFCSGF